MNFYFNKSIIFLCHMVLFLSFFVNRAIFAQAANQYDRPEYFMPVYYVDDGRYLLLEFKKDKLYFPLSTVSKEWTKFEEWKNLKEKINKNFPFNDRVRVMEFQKAIGARVDGNWGNGSWEKLAKNLESSTEVKNFRIKEFTFRLYTDQKFPLEPPEYEETPEFFKELAQWPEKCKNKKTLEGFKLSSKIVIPAGSNSSETLSWISEVEKEGFEIKILPVEKYIKYAEIENDKIQIGRVPYVYPEKVTLNLKIRHKDYRDINKNLEAHVYFPGKPWLRKLHEFISETPQIIVIFSFIASLILAYLLGGYCRYLKDKEEIDKKYQALDKLIKENQKRILEEVSLFYNTSSFYRELRSDVNNQIDNILFDIPNYQDYENKDQACSQDDPLTVNVFTNLLTIKNYIRATKKREEHYDDFLIKINNSLEPSRRISSLEDKVKSGDRIEIFNTIYKNIKSQIESERESIRKTEEKFQNLKKYNKQVLQPLRDDEDFFHFLSDKFWSEYTLEQQHTLIRKLSKKVQNLEISFPLHLKFIESQIQRASRIAEKLLKTRLQLLSKFNLEKDIEKLSNLLKEEYLRENDERPQWTNRSFFNISREKARELQDEFWEKIWNGAGLGSSIQIIQKVIFKLKLIVGIKDSIDEATFKDAYELEMVAGAVLYILQGIALSCSRLYHVIQPGHKVNLDFASPEGDSNILKDKEFKNISEKFCWRQGDIRDVSYWGLTEITSTGIKSKRESRVIVHYDKEGVVE